MRERLTRRPRPALRPFIQSVWAIDESGGVRPGGFAREHVVPTGAMHLVFRLSDALRLFESEKDVEGRVISSAVVGGARARFYIRDISTPLCSVGAQLRPGAAAVLFGGHAGEFAERHTALEDVWGGRAVSMRDRLGEMRSLEARLDAFEQLLAERLPAVPRGLHSAVAGALEPLGTGTGVDEVVKASGYSHRRFIEVFVRAVGLTPKVYSRVRRFQRALRQAGMPGLDSWASVAAATGYSDQPHFNREFRDCAGITPTRFRELAPQLVHHVPVSRR